MYRYLLVVLACSPSVASEVKHIDSDEIFYDLFVSKIIPPEFFPNDEYMEALLKDVIGPRFYARSVYNVDKRDSLSLLETDVMRRDDAFKLDAKICAPLAETGQELGLYEILPMGELFGNFYSEQTLPTFLAINGACREKELYAPGCSGNQEI